MFNFLFVPFFNTKTEAEVCIFALVPSTVYVKRHKYCALPIPLEVILISHLIDTSSSSPHSHSYHYYVSTMFRFLLITVIASLFPTTSRAAVDVEINILDLSQPWEIGNLNNPDAIDYESQFGRDIRRFMVIDNGKVVMDYQRDNIEDDEVYHLWSSTKVIMSTFIGVIIESDKYELSLNDTLGDIFTNDTAWEDIANEEELAYKKSITIYEMLTMTSGLFYDKNLNPFSEEFFLGNAIDVSTAPNRAGDNVQESLSFPNILDGKRGNYKYLQISNILSYVILERTGMTPLEFASLEIFPFLGIKPEEILWEQNNEGIESSFTSLYMNTHQMAKFAQWYLQKGKVSPTKQLVSEDWVNEAVTKRVWGFEGCSGWYGYLWCFQDGNSSGILDTDDFFLIGSYGNFGQGYLFNYETGRVTAWQRSNTLYDKSSGYDVLYGPSPGLAYRGALPDDSFQGNATRAFSGASIIGSSVMAISTIAAVAIASLLF